MQIRSGVAPVNGIELTYEDWGDVNQPALVLVMGLSAQMLLWPDGFCEMLVDKGFRVVRFDNRDIGLSTKIKSRGPHLNQWKLMARAQLGLRSEVPYTLFDMADDTLGLMDYLGIQRCHLVGASMGGMISQIIAGRNPERVLSLGIIFSSTNQPLLPPPAPSALLPLMKGPGKGASEEDRLAHSLKLIRNIASPAYPKPEAELRDFVIRMFKRSYHPAGVKRQFMAVLGSGNLRPYAKRVSAPTVVIHGKEDPLVRPACGKAVASAIRGSRFELIPGMAHDLPRELWSRLVNSLYQNTLRVEGRASAA